MIARFGSAEWLASQTESVRKEFFASLSKQERERLFYTWKFWARDNQLEPGGDWYIWLVLAGRGYGKTRMGAEWIINRAKNGRSGRMALIGQTVADVRDVMVEGESGILACSSKWFKPKYSPSLRRLTFPNGAQCATYSGDSPDQLRGPQHDGVWADEPAKWQYAEEAWSNMEFGLRLGDKPQAVATTTPRPVPLIKRLVADPSTHVTRGNTNENIGNLAPAFAKRIYERYEGTRLGRQELNAEILDDNPNALWKRSIIEANRVRKHPPLKRIVVAVDPQVADPTKKEADEKNAETGIVVVGVSAEDPAHGYVLDDMTVTGTPNEWGGQVVAAYTKWNADCVVVEINNGGAMVEFVIDSIAKANGIYVAVKSVTASRGKQTRAEPISSLYEQGRGHHVGGFATLEDQMCEWEPGQKSPDRMDALVWAFTELMVTGQGGWAESANALNFMLNRAKGK